jgi:hypothetical protein
MLDSTPSLSLHDQLKALFIELQIGYRGFLSAFDGSFWNF